MTLPSDFAFTLPPSFSSFHSEDALIQIQPTHRLGHLHLVSKSYGPLEPAQVCEVPLWCADKPLAMETDLSLSSDALQDSVRLEKEQGAFASLNFYWIEISQTLLSYARDDIPHADEIQTLLKDLQDVRMQKINAGLRALNSFNLDVDNLGSFEINEIRPFFTKAFNELRIMDPEGVILGEQIRRMQEERRPGKN